MFFIDETDLLVTFGLLVDVLSLLGHVDTFTVVLQTRLVLTFVLIFFGDLLVHSD